MYKAAFTILVVLIVVIVGTIVTDPGFPPPTPLPAAGVEQKLNLSISYPPGVSK